jgi:hypothetical protein
MNLSAVLLPFLGKPFENNWINNMLITGLNTFGLYKNIQQFIDKQPYWAMSIAENKETTNVLSSEQLKIYTKFLEEFYKNN